MSLMESNASSVGRHRISFTAERETTTRPLVESAAGRLRPPPEEREWRTLATAAPVGTQACTVGTAGGTRRPRCGPARSSGEMSELTLWRGRA